MEQRSQELQLGRAGERALGFVPGDLVERQRVGDDPRVSTAAPLLVMVRSRLGQAMGEPDEPRDGGDDERGDQEIHGDDRCGCHVAMLAVAHETQLSSA
jgi:hypothetical protein